MNPSADPLSITADEEHDNIPMKTDDLSRVAPQGSDEIKDPVLLRLALGYVYFHFGFLKFFPDLSPAEWMAGQTVMQLTGFMMNAETSLKLLAILECAIGLGLLFKACLRTVSVLFLLHMIGTYLPVFLMPELIFKVAPFAPNLEGQYIIKNLVFIAAGWTILMPHAFRRHDEPKEIQS